jgi:hypothetical protein
MPHLFVFVSQILCSPSNVICISNFQICIKSFWNAISLKSAFHVRFSLFRSVYFAFQIRRLSSRLRRISDSQFRIKSAIYSRFSTSYLPFFTVEIVHFALNRFYIAILRLASGLFCKGDFITEILSFDSESVSQQNINVPQSHSECAYFMGDFNSFLFLIAQVLDREKFSKLEGIQSWYTEDMIRSSGR